MAKYCGATSTTAKVMGMDMLNLKPIFDSFLQKIVRETPLPSEGCVSKTLSFSSMCQILGAQHPLGAKIWSSEKVDLAGTISPLYFRD